MAKEVYLAQLQWIIPTLIIDLFIPIIAFVPKLKKRKEIKIDGDFIGFIITLIVANCLFSYIIGILSYVKADFEETPIRSYVYIWTISLIIICIIEGLIFFVWTKHEAKATIKISMSPKDYKNLILEAEKGAKSIWFMPKRIHVMFKSQSFIHYLAEKRFGVGSEYIQDYENEHIARKAALYQGLVNGMIIHELHNKNDLICYIKEKTHNGVDNIEKQFFIEMLNEWKNILNSFPNNYCVRLTDDYIPLKYEIIDGEKIVIHESVGNNSRDRLNAIFIENSFIGKKISDDFLQVWEKVNANCRNNQYVIEFIDNDLLPLLN